MHLNLPYQRSSLPIVLRVRIALSLCFSRLVELRWDIRSVLSDNDSGSLDLSPEQWDLAKALLLVLRDLEEAT